jgi:hypothetical protein
MTWTDLICRSSPTPPSRLHLSSLSIQIGGSVWSPASSRRRLGGDSWRHHMTEPPKIIPYYSLSRSTWKFVRTQIWHKADRVDAAGQTGVLQRSDWQGVL